MYFFFLAHFYCLWFQVNDDSAAAGPSSVTSAAADAEDILLDDEDELDMDELDELEASLSRTSIQIQEPGMASSSWDQKGKACGKPP